MQAGTGNQINHYETLGYIRLCIAIAKQAVRDAKLRPKIYKDEVIRFLQDDNSLIFQFSGLTDRDRHSFIHEINTYKKRQQEKRK